MLLQKGSTKRVGVEGFDCRAEMSATPESQPRPNTAHGMLADSPTRISLEFPPPPHKCLIDDVGGLRDVGLSFGH